MIADLNQIADLNLSILAPVKTISRTFANLLSFEASFFSDTVLELVWMLPKTDGGEHRSGGSELVVIGVDAARRCR